MNYTKFVGAGLLVGLLFFSGCGILGDDYKTMDRNDDQVIPTTPVTPAVSSTTAPTDTASSTTKNSTSSLSTKTMEDTKKPDQKTFAVLHTSKGDITIELNTDATPITAGNFIKLADKKFYDNTIFHRVIKDFMIQGGDPEGTGRGGPGYKFADEPFTGEYVRGTVAMANAGPNTNGSQFFIMHKDVGLPKNYVIFGHVVKGIETVDAIANSPVEYSDSGEKSKPVTPITVKSVTIEKK